MSGICGIRGRRVKLCVRMYKAFSLGHLRVPLRRALPYASMCSPFRAPPVGMPRPFGKAESLPTNGGRASSRAVRAESPSALAQGAALCRRPPLFPRSTPHLPDGQVGGRARILLRACYVGRCLTLVCVALSGQKHNKAESLAHTSVGRSPTYKRIVHSRLKALHITSLFEMKKKNQKDVL